MQLHKCYKNTNSDFSRWGSEEVVKPKCRLFGLCAPISGFDRPAISNGLGAAGANTDHATTGVIQPDAT
jgi:hypothetical protein